jgi:hypothetical protein
MSGWEETNVKVGNHDEYCTIFEDATGRGMYI